MRFAAILSLSFLVLAARAAEPADVLRDAAAAHQAGDTAKAIRLYREFLKDHPDAAEIRSNLGAALARDAQFEAAIGEYRKALDQLPKNNQIRTNLALAYYKLGRLAEAVPELQILHETDPLNIKTAVLLADSFVQMGKPEQALDVLTLIQEESPDDRSVAFVVATALLRMNRAAEAKSVLDRMTAQGPSAESEFLLGQTEYIAQNPVAAASHLAKAVELNPNLPGLHSFYGQVLRSAGKLDEADEQFRLELASNPYDFLANTETAMQLKQERKFDEALARISRALQIRPNDAGALLQRGSIHMLQGKTDQAREELEQLTKAYPEFAEAHAALATVYYRLKRTADGDRERALARGSQR